MIFKSNQEKSFSQEEVIDLMVSLNATDANSEKKWRGFYNSLSKTELQAEWDDHWKEELNPINFISTLIEHGRLWMKRG
tara:strand:+ start:110 stop:346 length:237 start_codon:yes stop_codon:yes gene_type:complete